MDETKMFTVHLRDISKGLVSAWEKTFEDDCYKEKVKVSLRRDLRVIPACSVFFEQ